jgi:hypothetical protein
MMIAVHGAEGRYLTRKRKVRKMAILEDNSPAMIELEKLVDKVGLRNVIYGLAYIAGQKADHLRSNWQDEAAAQAWEADARKLDTFALKLSHTIIG